eukprot:CAMPEP_0117549834 /NCGR_PEP_ID=MMETSP0784-20121206/48370_1 /TAXON_ID=39447 /ORGANISM="" /LENGTH=361 /DNA_ID=CAMNT_0005346835 /DNA_START=1 /DNA_END=1083 /DNA_ORIENTATION=+
MLGVGDICIAEARATAAPRPVPADLDQEIQRLNTEWRKKRESFRSAQSSSRCDTPLPEEAPALSPVIHAPAPRAGDAMPGVPGASAGVAAGTALADGGDGYGQIAPDGGLSAAAASGSADACRQILERGLTGPNTHGPDGTTPLCAAALWGHSSVVQLLLQFAADPRLTNLRSSRPTALHTAALQESGKICMLLLQAGADPFALDGSNVSPADFAACSEAVWPIFAAAGCSRPSKEDLVARGVIRRASPALEYDLLLEATASGEAESAVGGTATSGNRGLLPEYSRPGSAYVVTAHHPPRPGSGLGVARPGSSSRPHTSSRPPSRPIDILEESEEGANGGDAAARESSGGSGPSVFEVARR